MNNRITTVLFDLDGTLIDTIGLITASFQHTLDHFFPGEYTESDLPSFIGPPLYETCSRLLPGREEEMIRVYRTFNLRHHDDMVTGYPGVEETLQQLREAGLKIGVVTTKRRETALRGLSFMQLSSYVDTVVSLDDVTHAKPHPEPLHLALRQLGRTPGEAVMVGDSEHDILGGRRAGTAAAACGWSIKGKAHLASFEPDIMLDAMPELVPWVLREQEARQ
ncbi:pyrophosphatase PpaX [Alkalicoccus urumqiensis]|uniref:Pyrophosphatase PpaX n=1 Tax=Alkalicoccus urumqiensis TaxID=1548213 RepID=A0A2P6MH46_ALKUR|nr:pyrophosphatase PpaX [Alkalicoccus urumqiensis]PRO65598.1 pyrophosphatase PpaX [Alkalicoccus urumqiensis]